MNWPILAFSALPLGITAWAARDWWRCRRMGARCAADTWRMVTLAYGLFTASCVAIGALT